LIQLIAVVVIAAQWRRASDRLKSLAKRLNQVYYGHWPGIIFTGLHPCGETQNWGQAGLIAICNRGIADRDGGKFASNSAGGR
jgi:hypothetical protein